MLHETARGLISNEPANTSCGLARLRYRRRLHMVGMRGGLLRALAALPKLQRATQDLLLDGVGFQAQQSRTMANADDRRLERQQRLDDLQRLGSIASPGEPEDIVHDEHTALVSDRIDGVLQDRVSVWSVAGARARYQRRVRERAILLLRPSRNCDELLGRARRLSGFSVHARATSHSDEQERCPGFVWHSCPIHDNPEGCRV